MGFVFDNKDFYSSLTSKATPANLPLLRPLVFLLVGSVVD